MCNDDINDKFICYLHMSKRKMKEVKVDKNPSITKYFLLLDLTNKLLLNRASKYERKESIVLGATKSPL